MEEFFDVVDEDDKVVGKATRKECHSKGLLHRSVMFVIFDSKGRILVNKRSQTKDFFPGYWSLALGGHVGSGETYDEAVVREAFEETGLSGKPFRIGAFKKRIPEEKENVVVYGITADRKPKFDAGEIAHGEFLGLDELDGELSKKTSCRRPRRYLA